MREIATPGYEQPVTLDYEQLDFNADRFDSPAPPSPPQPQPRRGFIEPQFGARATRGQKIFDALVGIALPLVCLTLDPVVFRSVGMGEPLLGGYRLFAYAVIGLEITLLALWLALGERVGEWGGMLGGAMLAGALFSLVVGILLLPYSVLGLIILIGAFGFSPFLTAFVYLRNGRRALQAAAVRLGGTRRTLALAFGAALALGAPAYAPRRVGHAVGHAVERLTGVVVGDRLRVLND